jgi:hypothetical protein
VNLFLRTLKRKVETATTGAPIFLDTFLCLLEVKGFSNYTLFAKL